MRNYTFNESLWKYSGDNAWYFITLPLEIAEEIKALAALHLLARRGFGSRRVNVSIGKSNWNTSIFPDKTRGSFLLPIKKSVRVENNIAENDSILINFCVLDI